MHQTFFDVAIRLTNFCAYCLCFSTTIMAAPFRPHIPEELIHKILSELRPWIPDERTALWHCFLASKRYRRIATPMLFKSVTYGPSKTPSPSSPHDFPEEAFFLKLIHFLKEHPAEARKIEDLTLQGYPKQSSPFTLFNSLPRALLSLCMLKEIVSLLESLKSLTVFGIYLFVPSDCHSLGCCQWNLPPNSSGSRALEHLVLRSVIFLDYAPNPHPNQSAGRAQPLHLTHILLPSIVSIVQVHRSFGANPWQYAWTKPLTALHIFKVDSDVMGQMIGARGLKDLQIWAVEGENIGRVALAIRENAETLETVMFGAPLSVRGALTIFFELKLLSYYSIAAVADHWANLSLGLCTSLKTAIFNIEYAEHLPPSVLQDSWQAFIAFAEQLPLSTQCLRLNLDVRFMQPKAIEATLRHSSIFWNELGVQLRRFPVPISGPRRRLEIWLVGEYTRNLWVTEGLGRYLALRIEGREVSQSGRSALRLGEHTYSLSWNYMLIADCRLVSVYAQYAIPL